MRRSTDWTRRLFSDASVTPVGCLRRTPRQGQSMTSRPPSCPTRTLAIALTTIGHRNHNVGRGWLSPVTAGRALFGTLAYATFDRPPDEEQLSAAKWANVMHAFQQHGILQPRADGS